jgi:hypothetical protein
MVSVIEAFIKSEKSENITSKYVVQIIKDTGIKDDWIKSRIITTFFESDKSTNITTQDFADMMKEVGLQNRVDMLTDLCKIKFPSPENYVKNFIDITKALHPSEAMQSEFVKVFIAKNQINQSNLEHLKPFIEGLQDNELALDIIENLSRKRILVNEKDTLNLVKNRSKKQYSFLTETFGDKNLQDCITQDGIDNLKGIFGNDLTLNEGNPITITALISYYDLGNTIPSLSIILTPEFKTELQNNFSPSAEKLLYKPQELEKLNQLLSQEGQAFDTKSYFVENEKLCDYIKEKAGVIAEVDYSKEYEIKFENFSLEKPNSDDVEMTEGGKLREEEAEKERQEVINDLFNKILKSPNPIYQDVDNFVSGLLGVFPSKEEDDKLLEFFKNNKKELAHCFCNENLKKEDFEALFKTLKDGCFANIGSQFKKMIYGVRIKDEGALILYSVADKEIFSAIINNHGEDIMVGNFDPIESTVIRSYSLSPMALFNKITQEEVLKEESWKIIGNNIGMDEVIALDKKLQEANGGDRLKISQESKKIASYFIVKEVVGDEKMTELENKNPKLKELGDFIYDRRPQLSPRESLAYQVQESETKRRRLN